MTADEQVQHLAAQQRIRDLETALRHQRELTEQARQRVRLLEETRAIAWRVAALGGRQNGQ